MSGADGAAVDGPSGPVTSPSAGEPAPGASLPEASLPEASLPGLLLAMCLLSAFFVAARLVSPQLQVDLRSTFGLSLNAGVVLALSLLPTRRRMPLFLLIVGFFSVLIRLPTDAVTLAVLLGLANLPAIVVFRLLALRFAAGGRVLESRRSLLALLGGGVTAVAVNAVVAALLARGAVDLGWVAAADMPSAAHLFWTRPAAQCDGIVTVTPLMLLLMHRRPGSWPWASWAETGAWLTLLVAASGAALVAPGVTPVSLLLLVAFGGLVLAVLRLGGLAAAVLTPAFAAASGVMLASVATATTASGSAPSPVLLGQVAGFVAAVLAWAVAIAVSELEEARRLVHVEVAAGEALATLQQALLPSQVVSQREVVVSSRYRAAGAHSRIGGDWYDTIALPSGGLALVIGDVEGHDLTAASVMGLVRGAVRSYALEGHPPSIVLERVSAFLASAGTERLVTMAYVQLYPGGSVATVALGGHPAPLVVPREGAASVLDVRRGPLLGVEGVGSWVEQTVRLPPGAGLALYTDGLVDFPAAPRDQQARLAALATGAAGESLDALADVLISAASPYDDAAVLVARMTARHGPVLRRAFPAQPISASIARVWLGDVFDIWQEGEVLPAGPRVGEHLDVAELLLTEMMSNAVRHSDRWVVVRLRVVGRRLRVEVEDTSERMPVLRALDAAAPDGRGLRLVDGLATDWGVQIGERGKTVWFELGPVDERPAGGGPPDGPGGDGAGDDGPGGDGSGVDLRDRVTPTRHR